MTDELVGCVLDGRYRVVEPLARGGMATVYRAEQLNVDREVAVKVMHPDDRGEGDLVARFRCEAKIISDLRHPNTLKLIDYGVTEDGMLYIVTELLSGRALSKIIQDEAPLLPRRVLHIMRDVCLSLAEAHRMGIVHRDLKPANIFLEEVGEQEVVKVLDFGVAKVTPSEAVRARGGPDATPETMAGVVLGTPSYLSPEQAFGRPVDGRADLYALGVVAFQCLTGRLPFEGEAIAQIAAHGLEKPPRPTQVGARPKLPPKVEALVLRLLEKEPDERGASAASVAGEIEDMLAGPQAESSRAVMWLAPVLAALAAIGAYVALEPGAPPPSVPLPRIGRDAGIQIDAVSDLLPATGSGTVSSAAVPPDAGVVTGVRLLDVEIVDGFEDPATVRGAVAPIEGVLVDCHEATQHGDHEGREVRIRFGVTRTGGSLGVEPDDDAGERFRRCVALRLQTPIAWPRRTSGSEDSAEVVITVGDRPR